MKFTGFLTLLFIGLKLTNYIIWSWLWVLSPMWIPLALWAFFVVLYGVSLLLMGKKYRTRQRLYKNLRNYGKSFRKH